jgi:hypothetical protein
MKPKYLAALTVVFLILIGASASAQEINARENGLFETDNISLKSEVGSVRDIIIQSASNLAGALTIRAAEQSTVQINYKKRAKASSRSMATDFIDLIDVTLSVLPNKITVKLRAPNPAPWSGTNYSGSVQAELVVPIGSRIEIEAPLYDVSARGPFEQIIIPESLGRLEIADVSGRVEVASVNRRVLLEDITGQISASTSNSSLKATNINTGDSQAKFRNNGGDIQIEGFVGGINAKNSYGRITILDFEPRGQSNYIRGENGPITLEISRMTEGQLVATNRHEDIDISIPDTLSAYLTLSVGEEGIIEATHFPFISDLVQRNRLSLIAGTGDVDISGTVRGKGNIYIRGTKGE